MLDAQYYALLARACPGCSRLEMRWHIDLAEGWSLIHAAGILAGQVFIWPDARLSKAGRQMLAVQKLREQVRAGAWKPQIDL